MNQRCINRAERSILFCTLVLALLTASQAQAQYTVAYTVNGSAISTVANTPTGTVVLNELFTYNGSPVSPVVIESNGHLDATYNGCWGVGSSGLSYDGIAVSPTIMATFTWTGSGAPPSSVIVSQTASSGGILAPSYGQPGPSDGLGDAPVAGTSPFPGVYYATSSGTHYQVKQGSTFSVSCSPTYTVGC